MTALFRVFRECKALAAVTDPDIASWGSVEMTDCADLDFAKTPEQLVDATNDAGKWFEGS